MKKTILTGLRPTGNLHLGHYFGACENYLKLQNKKKVDNVFIKFFSGHNFLFLNFKTVQKLKNLCTAKVYSTDTIYEYTGCPPGYTAIS
mgnify:CR=1 FL=1